MPTLVLLRHGESEWNLRNRFTGWTDVDLSPRGRLEAAAAGHLLKEAGVEITLAFTSVLKRAIRTLWIVLDELGRMWLPYSCHWRLNERHYGALQGLNKDETAAKFGAEQVRLWRRSYDVPPPPLKPDDPRHPRFDPRYAHLDPDELPAAESLKDTLQRLLPFWEQHLAPAVRSEPGVLVSAHGNSLRALVKHLWGVSEAQIPRLEIPTGNPLVVELDPQLRVQAARYLDSARAAALPPLGRE